MLSGNSLDGQMIATVGGKDSEWNNVVIPTENYLWARNVCRSMKQYHSDLVVISNAVWYNFHGFAEELHGKCKGRLHLLVLIPGIDSAKMALDDLGVYILDPETIDGNLHPQFEKPIPITAGLALLALLEVADLYIAWQGEGAR